jgi:hypothetical protein
VYLWRERGVDGWMASEEAVPRLPRPTPAARQPTNLQVRLATVIVCFAYLVIGSLFDVFVMCVVSDRFQGILSSFLSPSENRAGGSGEARGLLVGRDDDEDEDDVEGEEGQWEGQGVQMREVGSNSSYRGGGGGGYHEEDEDEDESEGKTLLRMRAAME